MRNVNRSIAVWLLMLSIGVAHAADAVIAGEVQHIHSAVLNEDRTYKVSVPPSYAWAKDRHYPVLFVLDGQTQFLHSSASVSFLSANGEIPEMIVVAIDSTVRIRDFTQSDWSTMWVGGGGAANFKRFLSTELIPSVDKAYRTNGFRVLSGHSAGGQFALYCLTEEPSLFQGYVALAPSLDWDNNLPQKSLEKSFESRDHLRAFLYFARSDDAGQALADDEALVATLKTKSPQGFRWYSAAFPDETHVSLPLLAQIDALRHLYAGYRFHPDLMEKGLAFAEQHYQEVSKTIGWPLPVPEDVINDFAYEALSHGQTQDAIALFNRNVEANPNSANAYDGLADGYAKAEMWKEAAAASDSAVALATKFDNPNLPHFVQQSKKMHDHLKRESEKSK